MYKLLIVDDECKIRDGISNAINWSEIHVEVVGTAFSGQNALDKVDSLHPEIIISDIRMDNMDGLELCEVLKDKYPLIKVILLTGYDEFEYAKKAIELNVFSYLLKPVLPEELKETVQKVVEKLDIEQKLDQKFKVLDQIFEENVKVLKDRFINELITNEIGDKKKILQKAQMLNMEFDKQYYRCAIFLIDNSYQMIKDDVKEYQLFLHAIIEIIMIAFCNHPDYSTYFTIRDNDVVCLIGVNSSRETKKQSELLKILEFVKSKIRITFNFTLSVLLGNCYDITEICKSYHESNICKEYKTTVGEDSIIEIRNVWSLLGKQYFYPFDLQNEIFSALNKDEEELRCSVRGFVNYLSQQKYAKSNLNMAVIQLITYLMSKMLEKGLNIFEHNGLDIVNIFVKSEIYENLEDLENRLWKIVRHISTLLEKEQQKCINTVVKSAIEYMGKNYENADLSLELVADKFFMTPNYFSRLFKKEVGESYKSYITNIRIEKAKRLLKDSNMRIVDISKSTGYVNSQYFCTAFKNVVGLTPKEYRERE